ncbi:MAG: hypothetical protein ABIN79_07090 [Marmoricola sp.]
MSILRKASTAAAISVAGAGIAVGGIGLAAADDGTSGQGAGAQTNSPSADGATANSATAREGRGPGDRGGSDQLAAGLAEALGVQQSDVTAALQAVREKRGPETSTEGETRTRPSETEREARRAEMAAALADELGVSEQRVTAAMDSLAVDRVAEGRSALAERLDTAVAEGSLTEAEKQAVLKAFDAGVLGGERHGRGGPGVPYEGAATS